MVRSQAVFVALGVDERGHRAVLALKLLHEKVRRPGQPSWKAHRAGLFRVQLVILDDHAGLRKAIPKIMGGLWQRCFIHFLT